MEQIPF